MTSKQITLHIDSLSLDELSSDERELVEQARLATYSSYAPYSRFYVGAAIRLSDGTIVTGSNQENAAFPSGMCAERTAAYHAHSAYPDRDFAMIAIAARDHGGDIADAPVTPCGACRQALLQYETLAGHPVPVLMIGEREILRAPSVSSLLPLAFTDF